LDSSPVDVLTTSSIPPPSKRVHSRRTCILFLRCKIQFQVRACSGTSKSFRRSKSFCPPPARLFPLPLFCLSLDSSVTNRFPYPSPYFFPIRSEDHLFLVQDRVSAPLCLYEIPQFLFFLLAVLDGVYPGVSVLSLLPLSCRTRYPPSQG